MLWLCEVENMRFYKMGYWITTNPFTLIGVITNLKILEHRKDLSSFVFFFHNFLLFSFPEWKGVSDCFGLFLERLVQEIEHALQRSDSAYSRVTLASCSLQWIYFEKSVLAQNEKYENDGKKIENGY